MRWVAVARAPVAGGFRGRDNAAFGSVDRRRETPVEPPGAKAVCQPLPTGDGAGYVARSWTLLRRRLGRSALRGGTGGVQAEQLAVRRAHDREQVAADPRRMRLSHAQDGRGTQRGIDRRFPQLAEPRAR